MNKPLPGDQVWGGKEVGGDGLLDDGLGHLANLLGHVALNSRWGKNIDIDSEWGHCKFVIDMICYSRN